MNHSIRSVIKFHLTCDTGEVSDTGEEIDYKVTQRNLIKQSQL